MALDLINTVILTEFIDQPLNIKALLMTQNFTRCLPTGNVVKLLQQRLFLKKSLEREMKNVSSQ